MPNPSDSPHAPEILRISVAELDTSVLPAGAPEPGTGALETAVMLHFCACTAPQR